MYVYTCAHNHTHTCVGTPHRPAAACKPDLVTSSVIKEASGSCKQFRGKSDPARLQDALYPMSMDLEERDLDVSPVPRDSCSCDLKQVTYPL